MGGDISGEIRGLVPPVVIGRRATAKAGIIHRDLRPGAVAGRAPVRVVVAVCALSTVVYAAPVLGARRKAGRVPRPSHVHTPRYGSMPSWRVPPRCFVALPDD